MKVGAQGLQWIVDGYTLTFASTLLSAGAMGDRWGNKQIFQTGLWVFILSSVMAGVVPSAGWLIVARFAQGLGAALLVPTSLALIRLSYPDRSGRAKAIGVWGGIGGIAAGAGPTFGGLLTAFTGWRSVFFINLPIGILGWWLTRRYVHVLNETKNKAIDLGGQLTAISGLGVLVYGVIEAGRIGWGAATVWDSFLLFGLAALVFIWTESRSRQPMLPLELFSQNTFSSAVVVGMILNLGFYGQLFILSLYFQQVLGYSVLVAALAISPQTVLAALASAWGGRLTSKTGPRVPMIIGLCVGAAGLYGIALVSQTASYWPLMLPMAAIGFGTAFTMPAATAAILETVPPGRAGIASGALNASRQTGGALGVALMGALVAGKPKFVDGMVLSAVIGGTAFLSGALLTHFGIERELTSVDKVKEKKEKS